MDVDIMRTLRELDVWVRQASHFTDAQWQQTFDQIADSSLPGQPPRQALFTLLLQVSGGLQQVAAVIERLRASEVQPAPAQEPGTHFVTRRVVASRVAAAGAATTGVPGPSRAGPRCSFCAKSSDQVRVVAGPGGVYICTECVALCRELFASMEAHDPLAREHREHEEDR